MSRENQPWWVLDVANSVLDALFWAAVGYVAWNDVAVPLFGATPVSWTALIIGGIAVTMRKTLANIARRIGALEKR